MHNPESVLEKERHKLIRGFDTQTDYLISDWGQNWELAELWTSLPRHPRAKLKKGEKKNKYFDLAREIQKTMEHKSDDDTKSNQCDRLSHQMIGKRPGRIEDKTRSVNTETTALLR